MSDIVKAVVRRYPTLGGRVDEPWMTTVYVEREDTTEPIELYKFAWSSTVTEACQAAIEQRAEFEQLLMDEVHASRATRRAICTCVWNRSQQGHERRCALADVHTMEPTA